MAKNIPIIAFHSLYKMLHYQFNKVQLLEQALTHRSVLGVNNERLEFLGDALLNFIIGAGLFKSYPKAREGELTRMRARLVREETLAEIARGFKLPSYIKLGQGEIKSGGHHRDSILADALEAIVGAIFLDSDIKTCQKVVGVWFRTRLKNLTQRVSKDAKTQLQEWLQAQKKALPHYELVEQKGDAKAQNFTVNCTLDDNFEKTQGQGTTRRKAEQVAAYNMLIKLKITQ